MTLTTSAPTAPEGAPEQKKAMRKQPAVKIPLSPEPSVQLLPAYIRDRAVVRSRIRTGVLLVVLGVVVAAALFAAGTLRATQAQLALQAANERTTDLLAQQARYAEAVRIDALVRQIESLQQESTATEVDWSQLVTTLISKVPEGGYITTVTAFGVASWEQMPLIGSTELPQIATISLGLNTLSVQDATAYSRSLTDLDGFASVSISKVGVGIDGRVSTSLTLTLTTGAESGRFADEED